MEDKASELGAYVKKHREAKGLTRLALGQAIGVPASTISRIEHGAIAAPDPAKLQRLAAALDVEVEELMMLHPTVKQGMPGFDTYFRVRYGMDEDAIAEVRELLGDRLEPKRRRRK